jgi:hypothetical protein
MLSLAVLAALAAAAPLPAGAVVLGLSSIEGTSTALVALLPDGTRLTLGEESHRAGFAPRGALAQDGSPRLVLAVVPEGAAAADVVVLELLEPAARALWGRGAVPLQPPFLLNDDAIFVRAAESPAGSTFDVVRARRGEEEVLTSTTGSWLTPVRGAAGLYLLIDERGDASLVDTDLRRVAAIGKERVRSPAVIGGQRGGARGGALIVERRAGARAEVIDVLSGDVLAAGLPGMDPMALGDRLFFGAGEKRAAIRVLRAGRGQKLVEEAPLSSERAGVASPRAAALVKGAPHIVAWLDRGQALPGELWLFSPQGARALLTPAPGEVVEVYGVIGDRR